MFDINVAFNRLAGSVIFYICFCPLDNTICHSLKQRPFWNAPIVSGVVVDISRT